jgi:hypothetical protein
LAAEAVQVGQELLLELGVQVVAADKAEAELHQVEQELLVKVIMVELVQAI